MNKINIFFFFCLGMHFFSRCFVLWTSLYLFGTDGLNFFFDFQLPFAFILFADIDKEVIYIFRTKKVGETIKRSRVDSSINSRSHKPGLAALS